MKTGSIIAVLGIVVVIAAVLFMSLGLKKLKSTNATSAPSSTQQDVSSYLNAEFDKTAEPVPSNIF